MGSCPSCRRKKIDATYCSLIIPIQIVISLLSLPYFIGFNSTIFRLRLLSLLRLLSTRKGSLEGERGRKRDTEGGCASWLHHHLLVEGLSVEFLLFWMHRSPLWNSLSRCSLTSAELFEYVSPVCGQGLLLWCAFFWSCFHRSDFRDVSCSSFGLNSMAVCLHFSKKLFSIGWFCLEYKFFATYPKKKSFCKFSWW